VREPGNAVVGWLSGGTRGDEGGGNCMRACRVMFQKVAQLVKCTELAGVGYARLQLVLCCVVLCYVDAPLTRFSRLGIAVSVKLL